MIQDVNTARQFIREVQHLAKFYNANYFIVTDGASATYNGNGGSNPAVKHARDCHVKWENTQQHMRKCQGNCLIH